MTKKEQLNKFVDCRQAAWMAGDRGNLNLSALG
jgi:hypothetical protein